MSHRRPPVAQWWLEDDCRGLCRKWIHSGKVPSNLSFSAPSGQQPHCLMKSIISFPHSDHSLNADGERLKDSRLWRFQTSRIKEQWIIPLGGREWDVWDVFNEMQALTMLTHTHGGCQDIEPKRAQIPPMAASEIGCPNQPRAILYACLSLTFVCVWHLIPSVYACLAYMFMHLSACILYFRGT